MTNLNLYATRNERIEWVQAQIAGLFDLEHNTDLYNAPEKWESIIDGAMGAARDYDAQSISSDTTGHTRTALRSWRRAAFSTPLTARLAQSDALSSTATWRALSSMPPIV